MARLLRPILFGWLLPYIGWETRPCHRDGDPIFDDPESPETPPAFFEADYLSVEWFGFGAFVMVKNVRYREGTDVP
jgi:hypothetical protein